MPDHNLTVEQVPVTDLAFYHRNPRQGNVDVIAESLAKSGQYRPIVVNRGTMTDRPNEVLAGNHTLRAAIQLGWSNIAAVHVDVSDESATRIVVADNRTADLGGYDDNLLADLLTDLPDLEGTGYTRDELDDLLDGLDNTDILPDALDDPDSTPEPPMDPITKPGDIWILGNHRVICGDSTDPEVVALVMAGDKAELVWTDPPYGVSYVGKTKDAMTIDNDALEPDELRTFLYDAFTSAMTACKPGAMWYVSSPPGPLFLAFGGPLLDLGIWRQTLTWVKDVFVLGRSHMHYRHEPIFYGWVPSGAALHPPKDRNHDTVWEVSRPKRNGDHPTMKPVELIVKSIELSSEPGAVVLDVFGGSGSTMVACQATGRRGRLVELDPKYVDVICRRYQEQTGDLPVLESSGDSVDFVSAAELAA